MNNILQEKMTNEIGKDKNPELINLEQQQSPISVRRFYQPTTKMAVFTPRELQQQQHTTTVVAIPTKKKELVVHLQNLYIGPKTYRPEYNFYNYIRFNQTQAIPIIYKTPTIFLNGLYFELPAANIIGITKTADTQTIKLVVKISRQDFQSAVSFDDISGVFSKIEEYNTEFFEKNASKMDIKIRRTLKNINGHASGQHSPTNNISTTFPQSTTIPTPLDDLTTIRFKTPGTKRLEYRSFYDQDGENITIILEIKQPYLAKIIQSQYLTLTSRHITNQAEISEPLRQYIQQIEKINDILNLDFLELKRKKIDVNLAVRPISIRLWIKCNMFGLDTIQNRIAMRWKVCNYEC